MRVKSIIILSIFLCFCTSKERESHEKTIFRYNESAGIQSFDPAFSKDQARVWFCHHIYNSIVALDSNLAIKPSIAKSWDISEDALTYEFIIRDDVYFHEPISRQVNTHDIVYSLNRLRDSKLASPGAWVLSDITSIEAQNDSLIRIELENPNPAFMSLLSTQYCSILPIESNGDEDFFKSPIGTGAFKFQYHKPNVKLVLRQNSRYFEFEGDYRLPYLDAVAISFIPDKQTAFLEFIRGNLDFLSGIDASYKDELLTPNGELNLSYKSKINFTKQAYLNTEYLGVLVDSNQTNIALKNSKVRQALNISFDKSLMIKYLRNNNGTPALNGFIPKGLPGYNASSVYSFDFKMAQQLLVQAGYPNGKGIDPVELSTTSSYLDLCEYIQHAWQQLGLDVKININPPSIHRQQVSKSQLSIFRGSWIADYPDAENYLSLFYSRNHSPNGPNYTHFSNAEFDSLYLESKQITDIEKRMPYYFKMDSMLMKEGVIIPLYYDAVSRFSNKAIQGLGSNPMNLLDLKQVQKRIK